jgi:type I restriction-modification system DNA methylase subunit
VAHGGTLHGSVDVAEYKHGILGLVFLKSISDAFEGQHVKLEAEHVQSDGPRGFRQAPGLTRRGAGSVLAILVAASGREPPVRCRDW